MMKTWLISILLVCASSAFSQSMITKVIDLNYCQADKVLALIQPLLKPGEKVSGSGQTLVVNISPETLTRLRLVIHKLDQPPVTFQITIHQGNPDWINSQDDDDIHYSASSNDTLRQNQSVNVINGASAFVSTGEEVPILSAVGAGWNTGVAYEQHQTASGLLVKPSLQGSRVKLKVKRIRDQQNKTQLQTFDNQQVDTTIMAPLNKWISLGSAQGAAQPSNSITYSAGNKFSHTATLFIKVSIVRN